MPPDYELPLKPKRTRRGSVCYYREWNERIGDIYVVKSKNPHRNRPSSIRITPEVRDELSKMKEAKNRREKAATKPQRQKS